MNSLSEHKKALVEAGFSIYAEGESFLPYTFLDVGALVFYATIIEWEFPGFSVEACFDKLCELQARIERSESIQAVEHRWFLVAGK